MADRSIYLTLSDLEFLSQRALPNTLHLIFSDVFKFARAYNQAIVEVTLSYAQSELLVSVLTDWLCEKGLTGSQEPNELGLRIEELIDLFNPYKFKGKN